MRSDSDSYRTSVFTFTQAGGSGAGPTQPPGSLVQMCAGRRIRIRTSWTFITITPKEEDPDQVRLHLLDFHYNSAQVRAAGSDPTPPSLDFGFCSEGYVPAAGPRHRSCTRIQISNKVFCVRRLFQAL